MSMRAVAGTLVVLLGSSCFTTREEGDTMRQDVSALKSETSELQREVTDLKAGQAERLARLEQRVTELDAALALVRQGDADASVQVERMVRELQTLRGDIEVAKNDLSQQKATVESILARPPATVAAAATAPKVEGTDPSKPVTIGGQAIPADPKAHYDVAKQLFDDKQFAAAGEAFDLFLNRHPNAADLVDNAAFWKAESFAQLAAATVDKTAREKAYKQAILSYQRVLESPKSEKADGALFKIGLAFEQLGFQDEARVFYEELLAKHAKSSLAVDAKKRLKGLPAKGKRK
jgi:TolA-binding protein